MSKRNTNGLIATIVAAESKIRLAISARRPIVLPKAISNVIIAARITDDAAPVMATNPMINIIDKTKIFFRLITPSRISVKKIIIIVTL